MQIPGVTTGVDRTKSEKLTIRDEGTRGVKQRSVRVLSGFGAGTRFGVHCSNLKNVARGIVERVHCVVRNGELTHPPQARKGVFTQGSLSRLRDALVANLRPTTVLTVDGFVKLYHGRKQENYRRAADSLLTRRLTFKDAWVNTFVKAEKVNLSAKNDPAPRVIQPRSPRFNIAVGRYLKCFERELCHGFVRLFGYRVILKGLNASGVAQQLWSNWQEFRKPVAVGLDASRFDQHVGQDALRFEHSVYNDVFNSPKLAKLLSWQLQNRGIARVDGYRVDYSVRGCRMSGDMNTGMGNCLIMSLITLAYCYENGIPARLANNGDDCVLIVEQSDYVKLAGIDEWFLRHGFTLTREAPVYDFERIEFCQSQPVLTSTGWRMVRNPFTAMDKDGVSLLGWDNETSFRAWCHAIGTCGLELARGVPVWEAWYKELQVAGIETAWAQHRIYECGMGSMARGVKSGNISDECRVSFYKAFGIPPDAQLAIESMAVQPLWTGSVPMVSGDTINKCSYIGFWR